MTTLSDAIKNAKQKDIDFFFGKGNIKTIKNSPCLIVGNRNAVFLKDWQVRSAHNYDNGINFAVVKLNRKFFKTYTFQNEIEGFGFDESTVQTFDDLVKVAEQQDAEGMTIALGAMN